MTSSEYTCPVCAFTDVRVFAQIPQMPVFCNVLWPTREAALEAARGDLKLGFCGRCGHVYNYAFDPDLLTYDQAYENSLHFSPRFQEYVDRLADHLIDAYSLSGKRAIDVGCGKGDFLKLLVEKGVGEGIGFDPSYEPELASNGTSESITIVQDLYSPAYTDYQADLVSCRHVLEHIQTPRDFMQTVRQAIGDRTGTAVFFEVPNVLYTLRERAIWDLIYEHCSYFSPLSLTYLFRESGFAVRHTDEAFGGQYLTLEAYPERTSASEGQANRDAAELDLLRQDVAAFAQRYEQKVAAWNQRLAAARHASERVVIWGSGSKGVTILNVLEARDQIEYAVDINPRKQGKHVAGTGQEIVPPAFLQTYQPDVIILMNAIYGSEVRQTVRDLGLDPQFEIA